MNWNKSHECNFCKWAEDVKCDEVDDGHVLLILTCKKVETLDEKIKKMEKKIRKMEDMMSVKI